MNVSNMKYFAKFSPAYETLELMSATKPMEIIEPSTMSVYSLEFGQKTQISNCNSNIKKMTPCVKKWYDTNFGTGYESMVPSTFNSSFTGLKGLGELHKGVKFIFSFLNHHIGGFQLLDLIIPELRSHVIPYKFKCSHWWKIHL